MKSGLFRTLLLSIGWYLAGIKTLQFILIYVLFLLKSGKHVFMEEALVRALIIIFNKKCLGNNNKFEGCFHIVYLCQIQKTRQ